jgi:hypothetical protein
MRPAAPIVTLGKKKEEASVGSTEASSFRRDSGRSSADSLFRTVQKGVPHVLDDEVYLG